MTVVAVAIVGGAIIGGVVASKGAKTASKAARSGATTAAQATVQATQLQVDELARQFDYQQQVLYPQLQQQYNAQGAFGDLMGITAADPAPSPPDYVATYDQENAQRQEEIAILERYRDQSEPGSTGYESYQDAIAEINNRPYRRDEWMANEMQSRSPTGRNDNFSPRRGPNGEFIDQNISQNRLADSSAYARSVAENQLAGTSQADDPYAQRVAENQLGDVGQQLVDRASNVTQLDQVRNNLLQGGEIGDDALVNRVAGSSVRPGSLADDPLNQRVVSTQNQLSDFARDTEIVGGEFRESPGYAFAKEEMQRELDRKNSAGGNYGGRAIMEAQRRAGGLADQEFYNYANVRSQELSRQDQAQQYELGRGDAAVRGFTDRDFQAAIIDAQRGDEAARRFLEEQSQYRTQDASRTDSASRFDIGRGDIAQNQLAQYQTADIGRGDVAFEDWMRRREGDVTRQDSAGQEVDRLTQYDTQRQDQAYYNYLNNLGTMAGFGGGAQSQAVEASQRQGSAVANVYGNEGSQLSNIYNQLGRTEAAIQSDRYENINNAIQSGAQNYATYRGATG